MTYHAHFFTRLLCFAAVLMPGGALFHTAACADRLPGTARWTHAGDPAADMVAGIGAWLDNALAEAPGKRAADWPRDAASPEAYTAALEPARAALARLIGAVDERSGGPPERIAAPGAPPHLWESATHTVHAVRWPVFRGVWGEGLLLEPKQPAGAAVIALPDADWTPEMLCGLAPGLPGEAQFARRLVEQGCRVLIPALMDRSDTFSGHPAVRMTNQPHREFLYRPAFQMGRHLIGYEVQQVLAALDWLGSGALETGTGSEAAADTQALPIGVFGYGEGGLIALHAGALDHRLEAVVVSGHFQPREALWREPIYRNVWGLLKDFGDAEIAALVPPRALLVEMSEHPDVPGPPEPRPGRSGAAPGSLRTPPEEAVRAEFARAQALAGPFAGALQLFEAPGGTPGQDATLNAFLEALGMDWMDRMDNMDEAGPTQFPQSIQSIQSISSMTQPARLERQFARILEDTQQLMHEAEHARREFWADTDASSPEAWADSTAAYREYLHEEVLGKLPEPTMPLNARSRRIYEEAAYTGYEVMLDVYPEVFAHGILLVPNGLTPAERRPVVVCQHGLEGRPEEIVDAAIESPYYHQYGVRLARESFIVYAPQNPYIGGDDFRVLQRKANPLKLSLFSFIVRQHERTLEWLTGLEFVDPERIAFYGLSYGGKTAMRVPPLLDTYRVVICSADFNEWIWKTVSSRSPYSYLFTGEYEMFEFDLGNTFNYGELSTLIFPRPFLVERGHDDGVAPDEWVAYEFAHTRRHYTKLGHGDAARIVFFDGLHEIHGVESFAFLREHLSFPEQ